MSTSQSIATPGALRVAFCVCNLPFLTTHLEGIIGTYSSLHVVAFTLERQLGVQEDRESTISHQDNYRIGKVYTLQMVPALQYIKVLVVG